MPIGYFARISELGGGTVESNFPLKDAGLTAVVGLGIGSAQTGRYRHLRREPSTEESHGEDQKSSKKRNARATDLSVKRKKAGDVKGGWLMAAMAAAAIRREISLEKQKVDDDQSQVQFQIQ